MVYKKVLKEVAKKYDGAEDFINNSIDEMCSQKNLSAEEVINFFVSFLAFYSSCFFVNFLVVKYFFDTKYKESLRLSVA